MMAIAAIIALFVVSPLLSGWLAWRGGASFWRAVTVAGAAVMFATFMFMLSLVAIAAVAMVLNGQGREAAFAAYGPWAAVIATLLFWIRAAQTP